MSLDPVSVGSEDDKFEDEWAHQASAARSSSPLEG